MLQSGQVINGTYLVDHRLGFGGMADVFLVTHARIPRQFALKLLRVEIGERSDFLDRFRREAEILASIRSAHIVDVIDWDYTYDGQPFIAMEYLEGETLAALLHRAGALPLATALDIFAQIGEGLCAAHAAGVVHRGLKLSPPATGKNWRTAMWELCVNSSRALFRSSTVKNRSCQG